MFAEMSEILNAFTVFGVRGDAIAHLFVGAVFAAVVLATVKSSWGAMIGTALYALLKEVIDYKATGKTFSYTEAESDFLWSVAGAVIAVSFFSLIKLLPKRRESGEQVSTSSSCEASDEVKHSTLLSGAATDISADSGDHAARTNVKKRKEETKGSIEIAQELVESRTSREHFDEAKSIVAGNGGAVRKTKILLVDDDDDFRGAMTSLLVRSYSVDAYDNAQDAYSALTSCEFDLLISDFVMPNVNGIQLVKQIRETKGLENLPIIILTGVKDELTINVLKSSPYVTLLQKDESLGRIRDLIVDLCPDSRVA